jgi:serine/threonine-protein phosphatase 2A regulatory subunit A
MSVNTSDMEIDAAATSTPPVEFMDEDPPQADDISNIAALIDDLKHEDIQYRLVAMKKLPVIAEALGPERTINELIPFLQGRF